MSWNSGQDAAASVYLVSVVTTPNRLCFAGVRAGRARDWPRFALGPVGEHDRQHRLRALIDEPAHLATCAIALLALAALSRLAAARRASSPRRSSPAWRSTSTTSPSYLGTHFLTGSLPRPYTHSALLVVVLLLLAWATSRRRPSPAPARGRLRRLHPSPSRPRHRARHRAALALRRDPDRDSLLALRGGPACGGDGLPAATPPALAPGSPSRRCWP